MKLHDEKYFQQLIENIIMWALVGLCCVMLAVLVIGPAILAFKVNPWWLSVYAIYLVGFFLLLVVTAPGKGGE